jgi:hypothetical protein
MLHLKKELSKGTSDKILEHTSIIKKILNEEINK